MLSIARLSVLGAVSVLCSAAAAAGAYKAPRTSEGQPDLQGVWSNSTLTPVERPKHLGEQRALTEAQAKAMEEQMAKLSAAADAPSDLSKDLPKAGDGVGGYNLFWADFGTRVAIVNGERRSSLTVSPANGQVPPLTPQAEQRIAERRARMAQGAMDGPEQRALGERCLLGFGTNSGPPMLPVMYNSNYQIVQTPDHVAIHIEMVHDVRVIPLVRAGAKSAPKFPKWMGTSVGRWEGETLVVETTGLHPSQGLQIGGGASYRSIPVTDQLKVTERFTRTGERTLLYEFTVEDPATFTQPWRAEIPMNMNPQPIYEYACHEGNYALPGILAGAREEEKAKR